MRFAAAASDDAVFFVSDDGYLYCLDLDNGSLRWRVRGGPKQRMVLGNERMVSAWPARGAPVLSEGRVYFAASIWPFMGLFVHCIDAVSGQTLWVNSGDGMNLTVQPHGAPSFATVAPQGHLVIVGNALIVPGGRSVPAVFDKTTGQLSHFSYDGKRGRFEVFAAGEQYFVDRGTHELANGKRVENNAPALALPHQQAVVFVDDRRIRVASQHTTVTSKTTTDFRGKRKTKHTVERAVLFELQSQEELGRPILVSGDQLWLASKQTLNAYPLKPSTGKVHPTQSLALPGDVWSAIAADDRLIVVTRAGELLCFAAADTADSGDLTAVATADLAATQHPAHDAERTRKFAREILTSPAASGYALVLGANDELVSSLFRHSTMRLVVIEPDERRAADARTLWQTRNWYGKRLSLIRGHVDALGLPPYFANIITTNEASLERFFGNASRTHELLERLRPYGGTLLVRHGTLGTSLIQYANENDQWKLDPAAHSRTRQVNSEKPNPNQTDEASPEYFSTDRANTEQIVRPGPLPDAGSWTHQYGDASQTGISADERVRAPLGILWYGGPSHDGILPRHGHGPSPQVAFGRIVIEGTNLLRCLDVYTGRLMWQRDLPGVGEYYDNTRHFPGAAEIGSNYVSQENEIYVVHGSKLLELDADTGETNRQFDVSDYDSQGEFWGHLAVVGDYLITTTNPLAVPTRRKRSSLDQNASSDDEAPSNTWERELVATRFASGSRRLVIIDRRSGQQLWSCAAQYNFRHNAIVAANNRLFVIDRLSDAKRRKLARRGIEVDEVATLTAFDLATGREIWKRSSNVFGTFLNYSANHDVLLQGGSVYRDRAYDESDRGLEAIVGHNGTTLWNRPELVYGGPCLVWKDRVITNGKGGFALSLLTGESTGWKYDREYGCNTAIGCQNLLTFRSGAAGFYDLLNDSGTGNLGGFRSSCTNNLIPADGVLAAPDYTRTCNCAYQNQTSLALVHLPELEFWTFDSQPQPGRLGINFGAPGDRSSDIGTLWTEFPRVGGGGPKVDVNVTPEATAPFRLHSTLVDGDPAWVYSSGLLGVEQIKIRCPSDERYQMKLYFLVPSAIDTPQHALETGRFNVRVQGKVELQDFCPSVAARGERIGVKRELWVQPQDGFITVEFERLEGLSLISGIELIEENRVEAEETAAAKAMNSRRTTSK